MLLGTIPAGALFSAKMATLGFDKPCAAGYYSRVFFVTKIATLGFHLVDFDEILQVFTVIFPQCPPGLSRDQLGRWGRIFLPQCPAGGIVFRGG